MTSWEVRRGDRAAEEKREERGKNADQSCVAERFDQARQEAAPALDREGRGQQIGKGPQAGEGPQQKSEDAGHEREKDEGLPSMNEVRLEKEIVSLLFVLRALIEGAK